MKSFFALQDLIDFLLAISFYFQTHAIKHLMFMAVDKLIAFH